MTTLATLIDAATLKGYLIATNAPENIIALAVATVDGVVASLQPDRITGPGIEEYLPQIFVVADAPAAATDDVPPAEQAEEATPSEESASAEEVAIAAPEMPRPEGGQEVVDAHSREPQIDRKEAVSLSSIKIRNGNPDNVWEEWQLQKLVEMKNDGAIQSAIAVAVKKTPTQVNNKWTWLSKALKKNGHAARPAVDQSRNYTESNAETTAAEESWSDLIPEYRLAEVVTYRRTHNVRNTAEKFGVSLNDMVSFLERHEVDSRLFPSKADKTDTQQAKFETVIRKDMWGNEREERVPVPLGQTKDPVTGAVITKYPPGYAIGAGPQRNVKPTQGGY